MSAAIVSAAIASAVRLRGLAVESRQRTLLQVNALDIREGERVALVGANGAGKSTLLRVLSGLLVSSRGHVEVLGRRLDATADPALSRRDWRALRAEIGQVMQGLHLVPRLTALENVLIGSLARRELAAWRSWTRLYPEPLVDEARAALDRLGLEHQAATRADRLSGGERQKVGIARMLMQRPRLVLADEPTSALDPASAEVATAVLREAAARATLVTVVHQVHLLPRLADRVIGLAQGRIVWDLPLAAVSDERLTALYVQRHGDGPAAASVRQPVAGMAVGAVAP